MRPGLAAAGHAHHPRHVLRLGDRDQLAPGDRSLQKTLHIGDGDITRGHLEGVVETPAPEAVLHLGVGLHLQHARVDGHHHHLPLHAPPAATLLTALLSSLSTSQRRGAALHNHLQMQCREQFPGAVLSRHIKNAQSSG